MHTSSNSNRGIVARFILRSRVFVNARLTQAILLVSDLVEIVAERAFCETSEERCSSIFLLPDSISNPRFIVIFSGHFHDVAVAL